MNKPAIVIAERNHLLRNDLKSILMARGYDVYDTACKSQLTGLFARYEPELFIIATCIDLYGDGLEIAATVHRRDQNTSIILITTESNEDFAISALRIGASVLMYGHASTESGIVFNKRLSENQMEIVVFLLRAHSLGALSISKKAFDESNPLVEEVGPGDALEQKRQWKRLIEIIAIKPPVPSIKLLYLPSMAKK